MITGGMDGVNRRKRREARPLHSRLIVSCFWHDLGNTVKSILRLSIKKETTSNSQESVPPIDFSVKIQN